MSGQRRMSQREADKISRLFERGSWDRKLGLSATERTFLDLARDRGLKLHRNGWPDFLAELKSGEIVGIEVKSENDRLSRWQKSMFPVLESLGIKVFVWTPLRPRKLIPWQRFVDSPPKQKGGRSPGKQMERLRELSDMCRVLNR